MSRVTGHLKLVERGVGPVWYAKTRVPGRDPEQTTRRLAPAHLTGGECPAAADAQAGPGRAGRPARRRAPQARPRRLRPRRRHVRRRRRRLPAPHRARPRPRALHAPRLPRSIDHLPEPALGRPARHRDHPGRRRSSSATSCSTHGLSPRTVVRHLTVAHGVFKYAMRKHGLTRNPASADLVDRPTVRYSGEFVTLDAEQLAALMRAAATRRTPRCTSPPRRPGCGKANCARCGGGTSTSPPTASTSAAQRPTGARATKTPKSGKVRSRAHDARRRDRARHAEPPRALHRRRRPRVRQRGRRDRERRADPPPLPPRAQGRRPPRRPLPRPAARVRVDRGQGVPALRRAGDARPRARHDHDALRPPPARRRRRSPARGGVRGAGRVPEPCPETGTPTATQRNSATRKRRCRAKRYPAVADCKAVYTGSIPVGASSGICGSGGTCVRSTPNR